jgi:hypothetical protein
MLFDQRETYPDQDETYPDQDGTYWEPGTYWRRRAATLAAGLGVLGLLVWAFSSGGGTPASHNAATSASTAAGTSGPMSLPAGASAAAGAGAGAGASPGAGAGASPGTSASAGAAVPGLARPGTSGLPSATSSPARKPAKQAKHAKPAKPAKQARRAGSGRSTAPASGTRTARSAEPGGQCAPGSVVLSLFGGSRDYRGGQEPAFGVDVVSTAPGTCTVNLGPAQFHLVVMSAGRVIWDSADCARSDGTRLAKLTRGVPVQQSFTWNRAITLPGCVTLASSARPGSYTAQARTGSVSSQGYSFRLLHLIQRANLPSPRPAPAGCPRPQPPR